MCLAYFGLSVGLGEGREGRRGGMEGGTEEEEGPAKVHKDRYVEGTHVIAAACEVPTTV